MKKKKYDCIKDKHRGTLRIYEETKNMTLEEELVYWQRKDQIVRCRQARLRKKLGLDRKANPRDCRGDERPRRPAPDR